MKTTTKSTFLTLSHPPSLHPYSLSLLLVYEPVGGLLRVHHAGRLLLPSQILQQLQLSSHLPARVAHGGRELPAPAPLLGGRIARQALAELPQRGGAAPRQSRRLRQLAEREEGVRRRWRWVEGRETIRRSECACDNS